MDHFDLTNTSSPARKLEYHHNTNSVPLNEEKQILKLIGDLEKKKSLLVEWENYDKQNKETKVRWMKRSAT